MTPAAEGLLSTNIEYYRLINYVFEDRLWSTCLRPAMSRQTIWHSWSITRQPHAHEKNDVNLLNGFLTQSPGKWSNSPSVDFQLPQTSHPLQTIFYLLPTNYRKVQSINHFFALSSPWNKTRNFKNAFWPIRVIQISSRQLPSKVKGRRCLLLTLLQANSFKSTNAGRRAILKSSKPTYYLVPRAHVPFGQTRLGAPDRTSGVGRSRPRI